MKTNYLTLSVMALAAAFTACSQDNEIPETNVSDNTQALTIQATESGFEAAEKEGRATDDGKTTVFEDGDKMGLFVVRDNGSVVKSNEPIPTMVRHGPQPLRFTITPMPTTSRISLTMPICR